MPEPIDMPKRNNLGYAEDEFLGEYVGMRAGLEAVSYTHLTLPTIYSV